MYAYVGSQRKRVNLDPSRLIGQGGEAEVYDIGGGAALKVFKGPDHMDFSNEPKDRDAARARIALHQKKLPAFPKNLPSRVIAPQELAYHTQSGNDIVGYSMQFMRGAEVLYSYAQKNFRQQGIPDEIIPKIFLDLHGTISGIHQVAIIGDNNDLNALVQGAEVYLIDADSFQFGSFLCSVFTTRFVDPLLCDPKESSPLLAKPYTANSDWYAYAVMLMQCLLFVDPYGGIYKPKDPKKRVPHDARPLQRITVFHPEVHYPKPATHFSVLPDDLLHYFHRVFEKDERGEFPALLLGQIQWNTCTQCGLKHARQICPQCAKTAPSLVKEVITVRGKVTAERFFTTRDGTILFATMQNGRLQWLYHAEDAFRREDGSVVIRGALTNKMRFRIHGSSTILGADSRMVTLTPGAAPEPRMIDSYRDLPMFDANGRYRYWVQNGDLMRDGALAPERIGGVLSGQTLFWIGERFGFGFYRAGNLQVGFVFDAERRGLNDQVAIPPLRGQLVDSTCVFAGDLAWFFVSTQEKGKNINRCALIRAAGSVQATAEAQEGDGSWLGTIRGKCAAGNFLLSATDEGIVKVEAQGSQILETRRFPDTEPFVDSGTYLFPGKEGVYAVSTREITLLKIG